MGLAHLQHAVRKPARSAIASIQEPIEIFCDNEGAVALTKEPKDHGKSRHIDRKYHFVRHKVEEGKIIVKRVSSEENPADPFTKILSKAKQKTAYEILRSDWSSDVCSSDLSKAKRDAHGERIGLRNGVSFNS